MSCTKNWGRNSLLFLQASPLPSPEEKEKRCDAQYFTHTSTTYHIIRLLFIFWVVLKQNALLKKLVAQKRWQFGCIHLVSKMWSWILILGAVERCLSHGILVKALEISVYNFSEHSKTLTTVSNHNIIAEFLLPVQHEWWALCCRHGNLQAWPNFLKPFFFWLALYIVTNWHRM